MIVEMRVYHCLPGRLPALNERFTRHTLGFFGKHGIRPIGFWTTLVGPTNHALTYLLEWQSLAERDVPEYVAPDGTSKVTFTRVPTLDEVPYPVRMEPNLVVEFYSR